MFVIELTLSSDVFLMLPSVTPRWLGDAWESLGSTSPEYVSTMTLEG